MACQLVIIPGASREGSPGSCCHCGMCGRRCDSGCQMMGHPMFQNRLKGTVVFSVGEVRSGPGPDRVQTVPALFIYLFIQD